MPTVLEVTLKCLYFEVCIYFIYILFLCNMCLWPVVVMLKASSENVCIYSVLHMRV